MYCETNDHQWMVQWLAIETSIKTFRHVKLEFMCFHLPPTNDLTCAQKGSRHYRLVPGPAIENLLKLQSNGGILYCVGFGTSVWTHAVLGDFYNHAAKPTQKGCQRMHSAT